MNARFFSLRNIILLLLVALVAFIAYQKIGNPTQASEAPKVETNKPRKAALSIEVVKPISATWPTTIKVNGGVFPWQEAIVSSEISGLRIKQVLVDVGSMVKRGQALVILAGDTVQAELQKQKAVVARDKAALAEAEQNANRARDIQDSGALSKQKINGYFIAEQTAKANLALSLAELTNTQLKVRQTRVLAPDNGVISSRAANLGNVVSAGSELFRLIRQNRIEWRAEAGADQLPFIKKGQLVQITQSTNQAINGVVRMVSPTVNTQSRNALVYIDLPKESAKSGMYLTGTIDIGEQAALVVPQSAVILRDGMAYLFEVVELDGVSQVVQRKVVTGRTQNNMIEVLEGVNANANYTLTGGAFLNDADVVKVINTLGVKP